MFFAGAQYLHTVPTAGNDLVLIVLLAAVGLTFGVLGGFATHGACRVRPCAEARSRRGASSLSVHLPFMVARYDCHRDVEHSVGPRCARRPSTRGRTPPSSFSRPAH